MSTDHAPAPPVIPSVPTVLEPARTAAGPVLHIGYDGSCPPLDLFARLAAAGWDTPVPSPPPREAIDWTTPDPIAGTRHSIRPFAANGTATLATGADEVTALMVASAFSTASPSRRHVTTLVHDDQLGRAVALVAACGYVAATEPVVTSEVVRYRGQRRETEVRRQRIVVELGDEDASSLIDALLQVAITPPVVTGPE